MQLPFQGGCVCGDIRYDCITAPLKMINCHCRDCQKVSGGPYAPIMVVPFNAVTFTQGGPRQFATIRINGRPNPRGFCGRCGSRLTVGEDPKRNIIGMMAASLDDPSWFQPTANIFAADAQPWDSMDLDVPLHAQHMPRER